MLSIDKIQKQYGVQVLYDHADLFVGPDDRVGLVGPNGTGKSTLFKMILGVEEPDQGNVRLDDHKTVGMLSQESQCRLGVTVREEMQSAFPESDEANDRFMALAEKLESAQDHDGHEVRSTLREMAEVQTNLEMQGR